MCTCNIRPLLFPHAKRPHQRNNASPSSRVSVPLHSPLTFCVFLSPLLRSVWWPAYSALTPPLRYPAAIPSPAPCPPWPACWPSAMQLGPQGHLLGHHEFACPALIAHVLLPTAQHLRCRMPLLASAGDAGGERCCYPLCLRQGAFSLAGKCCPRAVCVWGQGVALLVLQWAPCLWLPEQRKAVVARAAAGQLHFLLPIDTSAVWLLLSCLHVANELEWVGVLTEELEVGLGGGRQMHHACDACLDAPTVSRSPSWSCSVSTYYTSTTHTCQCKNENNC